MNKKKVIAFTVLVLALILISRFRFGRHEDLEDKSNSPEQISTENEVPRSSPISGDPSKVHLTNQDPNPHRMSEVVKDEPSKNRFLSEAHRETEAISLTNDEEIANEKVRVLFPFREEFTSSKEKKEFSSKDIGKSPIFSFPTQGTFGPEIQALNGVYSGTITFGDGFNVKPHNFLVALKFRSFSPIETNGFMAVTDISIQEEGSDFWFRSQGKQRDDFSVSNPFEAMYSPGSRLLMIPITLTLFKKTNVDKILRHIPDKIYKIELNLTVQDNGTPNESGPVIGFPSDNRTLGSFRIFRKN